MDVMAMKRQGMSIKEIAEETGYHPSTMVRYSVPPRCLGQRVEVRQEVGGSSIEIRWAAEHVATHAICDVEGSEVWDAGHFAQAQSAALSRSRGRHLSVVLPDVAPAAIPLRLEIEGDVEVEVPDLGRYEIGKAPS
jgi:hypothetical protein